MRDLVVEDVNISYNKILLLDNITFHCNKGEIVGVFGRNGSGKSTMFRMIFGTERRGTIKLSIDNKTIGRREIIPRQLIAMLPQESFLPKSFSVNEIISSCFKDGNKQSKIFYSPRIAKIERQKIGALSPGELKYLEILLIGHLGHPYILFDEPFSMVEPLYKELIQDFLLDLKSTKGLIITDHYYNDVLALTDRNLLLKDARLTKVGNAGELVKKGYIPNILI